MTRQVRNYEFSTPEDADKAMKLCRTVAQEAIRECARVIHNNGCYYEAGRLRAMAHNPHIFFGTYDEDVTDIGAVTRSVTRTSP